MKLNKYNQEETLKYWDNQEEIDVPEYEFNEKHVRGVWIQRWCLFCWVHRRYTQR